MDDKILLHKLNNSLQTIQGTAELLRGHLSEKGKEHIECIQKDVQEIARELRG